jgi:hypothetical protein
VAKKRESDDTIKATFNAPAAGEPGHEFLSGVPAHDLTDAEYATLSPEDRVRVHDVPYRNGTLYTVKPEKAAAPKQKAADEKPPEPKAEPISPPVANNDEPPPPPLGLTE